jgi:putative membrane protein
MSYGPKSELWRSEFLRHTSEFPFHVVRVLRENLEVNLAYISSAKIAQLIAEAKHQGHIGDPAFFSMEKQRALLVDHLGACERILKSPLPLVLDIKVRRFLLIYLLLVPIGLVTKIGWYTPALMFFVSYSMLALDQIGVELQNPFSKSNLSSLPIDDISKNIKKQILFMSQEVSPSSTLESNHHFKNAKVFQMEPMLIDEQGL